MQVQFVVSEINIPVERYIDKVRADKFWHFAAQEWYRLYYPFIPFRTGMLANRVVISPGQIIHNVPYSIPIYNGKFNFRKDLHPLASRQWDKAAEPSRKPQLVHALQIYVDNGGLHLGE